MEPILCDQPFQFSYWINNPLSENGWSETWHLIDIEREKALAAAQDILEARSWILGANLYIELAELRRLDLPRRSFFFPQDPLFPLPQWDIAHDDYNGVRIRFQTAHGKYCNHVIRGLERGTIKANAWTTVGATLLNKPTVKPLVPALASKTELLRYFFWLLKKHTCWIKKQGDFFSLIPWAFLGDNGVKSLAAGRAVQRVSAEWAYWFYAPPFSYCGTVCGVQRPCRSVACRPYKDGPNMPIRFYFAAPGATLFPWDTIFWGTYRDKDIPTGGNPGEIKGAQYTVATPSGKWQYSSGFSYGSAPGLVPTGTPDDFLGLGIKPWADLDDPNPHAGALCDMPIFSFTLQDVDATTVIVGNCMTAQFENSDFVVTEPGPGVARVALRPVVPPPVVPADQIVPYKVRVRTTDLQVPYTKIGNVITADVDGSIPSQDGASVVLGDDIIFAVFSADGGVYRVTDEGSGTTPFVLTRSPSFDTTAKHKPGVLFYVKEGTVWGGRLFTLLVFDGFVLNTDTVLWTFHTKYNKSLGAPASILCDGGHGDIASKDVGGPNIDAAGTLRCPEVIVAQGTIQVTGPEIFPGSGGGFLAIFMQNQAGGGFAPDWREVNFVSNHGFRFGITAGVISTSIGIEIYSTTGLALNIGLGVMRASNGFFDEDGQTGLLGPGCAAIGGVITNLGSGAFLTKAQVLAMVLSGS